MSEYRLMILGALGVGKTSLTVQLCSNHFLDEYDPTIEDSYRKRVVIDNESSVLSLYDTASVIDDFYCAQNDFKENLFFSPGREAQGVVLVYSISSRSSFDEIENIYMNFSY